MSSLTADRLIHLLTGAGLAFALYDIIAGLASVLNGG